MSMDSLLHVMEAFEPVALYVRKVQDQTFDSRV